MATGKGTKSMPTDVEATGKVLATEQAPWLCGPGEEEPPDDYTGPFSMRPMQNRVGFEADRKRAASWLAWITFGINCFFALITDCPFAGIAVGLFPSIFSITFFLDARNGICQLHCSKGQQVSDIGS